LRVVGEVRLPVPPLSLSAGTAQDEPESEAARLFVERARAVRPDFDQSRDARAVVASICARLDGLPLAIELAAARTGSLPVRVLLEHLQSAAGGLPLLAEGPRDAPERQQTLRAAITWSYDLLTSEERALFRRLAPFRGCTLEAVKAVCIAGVEGPGHTSVSLSPLDLDAHDGLASLVTKSLLQVEADDQGKAWYTMLETVRQFALERLEASQEVGAVWRRHTWYYLRLVEEQEAGFSSVQQDVFFERLEHEQPNCRAALDWCQAQGYAEAALRLAIGLWWFWAVRGRIAEGRTRLEALLTRFPLRGPGRSRATLHAKALVATSRLAWLQGDLDSAHSFARQSLELMDELDDVQGVCAALEALAYVARQRGEYGAARSYHERSLATARAVFGGDARRDPATAWLICDALAQLGLLAHDQGDLQLATALLEDSRALVHDIGDVNAEGIQTAALGLIALDAGDHERARRLTERGLALIERVNDRRSLAVAVTTLGSVATAQRELSLAYRCLVQALRINQELREPAGMAYVLDRFAALALAEAQPERALRLAGAAAGVRELAGAPLPPSFQVRLDQKLEAAHRALGRLAAAALVAGHGLSLEDAIAEALATQPAQPMAGDGGALDSLSSREREVAHRGGDGEQPRRPHPLQARAHHASPGRGVGQPIRIARRTTSGEREEVMMPLFLDIHTGIPRDATHDALANGHALDVAVQDKYGVRYLKAWYDSAIGRVFCLSLAPSKDAALAVHREAHGQMPDEIFEVQEFE
jgi:predicted ATPase